MSSITLTREQLYERVWSQPMIKVAADLGLSDVAVKKMCRRMQVPAPPRGYWARIAAGQKLRKPALAKIADIAPVRIDPVLNAQRREKADRLATAQALMTPIELPENLSITQLHPQARAVHGALKKAKPDHHGRVETPIGDFPNVDVGVANIDRVSRVLHVIFSELESRGIILKPVSVYDRKRLGFVRGIDEAAIMIEEPIATIKREPTPEERRRPSSEWKTETTQPSGQFKITVLTLYTSPYNASYRSMERALNRSEGPRRPIGMLLREIIDGIWQYFVRQDEIREQKKQEAIAEAERKKAEEERKRIAAEARAVEAARRKEEERQERHRQKLAALAAARVENTLRAAEWWRLHQLVLAYAAECERQWQTQHPGGTLTEEQNRWLVWIRAEANAMSPFSFGYPDFTKDGPFDGSGIPVDGPYPAIVSLPLPPTMPPSAESPQPKEPSQETPPAPPPPMPMPQQPSRPQFPYWLLHRHRR
jgi:hypothetical protein